MFFVWFQCISFVSVARKFWRALTKTINHKAQRTHNLTTGKQQAASNQRDQARSTQEAYADVCIGAKSKNKSF
jgi:hypothetical protein